MQRLGSRAEPWATPTLPGARECHCRGRTLDPRVISPASVSPGVRRYGNTAQLSLGCRALPVELPRPRISPAGRYRSFPTKLDTRGLSLLCYKEGKASSSGRLRRESVPE